MRGPKEPSGRGAFTLVELLVVIGIIAVLIAILLPTLRNARASVQFVACRSNLNQIAVALRMYANDFRDHWPDPVVAGDDPSQSAAAYFRRGVNWPDDVNPAVKETLGLPNLFHQRGYLKSGAVWLCPSSSDLNVSFGNSYITQISKTIAGYTSKPRNRLGADVTFIYDNYLYSRPQDTNVPRSAANNSVVVYAGSQYVYPHAYKGKLKYAAAGASGKGRQGAVNCLYADGVVGIVVYADNGGSSPATIKLRGE